MSSRDPRRSCSSVRSRSPPGSLSGKPQSSAGCSRLSLARWRACFPGRAAGSAAPGCQKAAHRLLKSVAVQQRGSGAKSGCFRSLLRPLKAQPSAAVGAQRDSKEAMLRMHRAATVAPAGSARVVELPRRTTRAGRSALAARGDVGAGSREVDRRHLCCSNCAPSRRVGVQVAQGGVEKRGRSAARRSASRCSRGRGQRRGCQAQGWGQQRCRMHGASAESHAAHPRSSRCRKRSRLRRRGR